MVVCTAVRLCTEWYSGLLTVCTALCRHAYGSVQGDAVAGCNLCAASCIYVRKLSDLRF